MPLLALLYSSSGIRGATKAVLAENQGLSPPLAYSAFYVEFASLNVWAVDLMLGRTLKKQRNGKSSYNTDAKLSNVERDELRIPGTQRRPL